MGRSKGALRKMKTYLKIPKELVERLVDDGSCQYESLYGECTFHDKGTCPVEELRKYVNRKVYID